MTKKSKWRKKLNAEFDLNCNILLKSSDELKKKNSPKSVVKLLSKVVKLKSSAPSDEFSKKKKFAEIRYKVQKNPCSTPKINPDNLKPENNPNFCKILQKPIVKKCEKVFKNFTSGFKIL